MIQVVIWLADDVADYAGHVCLNSRHCVRTRCSAVYGHNTFWSLLQCRYSISKCDSGNFLSARKILKILWSIFQVSMLICRLDSVLPQPPRWKPFPMGHFGPLYCWPQTYDGCLQFMRWWGVLFLDRGPNYWHNATEILLYAVCLFQLLFKHLGWFPLICTLYSLTLFFRCPRVRYA